MANYYEVPLTAEPQRLTVMLSGVAWFLTLSWNIPLGVWVLDFADADQVPVLSGVPLVAGCDILGQHQHLGFGGSLVAQADASEFLPPDFTNLGTTARVLFVTE